MAKPSTTDPSPGSHHLMAILNALPSSNFHQLEEAGSMAADASFWAGIVHEGQCGPFNTDSCDENAGFLAFSKHSESGFDRFVLKVYLNRGSEVVLWAEEASHAGSRESTVRLWDRGLAGEWKDCTFGRMGRPRLSNLYPGLEIEEDLPLQARYLPETDQVVFASPAREFPAEVHQQMLNLVAVPELHCQFRNGRFAKQPQEISEIESLFYRLPDAILQPLIAYLGIAPPAPHQLNPSFRKMLLHDSDHFRDQVIDPSNGYLSIATNTDGAGKTLSMTFWEQSKGECLVGVVLTDWSLSCESGILRFLRPLDKGWADVTDEVAPSLALGDLPWLKGKSSLSGDELKIQAFDISLPREGDDIRLWLDRNTLEDALLADVEAKGIGDVENFAERVLRWDGVRFGFGGG